MLLLLMLLLVVATCAAPPQQKRSLGPRLNETGRFYYDDESQPGHRLPCRFCPPEALTNSQYSYMQVPKCMDFYKDAGKPMTEILSMKENQNQLYALCNEGPIPGCGIAPFNHTNSTWVYGYGFGEKYSVYSIAELRCDLTNKIIAQLYCNESLEWQTDFSDLNKCKAVGAVRDPGVGLVVGIAVGAVVSIAIGIVVVYCCWRRWWKRKLPPSPAEPDDELSIPLNLLSTTTCCPHEPPQPDDPLEGPQPSVKVFNRLTRDSLQDSCKIGDATFKVQEGSTFYIVAWAPPNMTIIRFHIVRSDGAAYRGWAFPEEVNLQNFHLITDARHEDDGVYTWTIQTETETYTNTVKIVIKRPADGAVAVENAPYNVKEKKNKTNEVMQQNGENVRADNQGQSHYHTLDIGTFDNDNIGEVSCDRTLDKAASNIRTESNESVRNGNNSIDILNMPPLNRESLESLAIGNRPEPIGEPMENAEGQGDSDGSRVNRQGQIGVPGDSEDMRAVSTPMPVLASNGFTWSILDSDNTDVKQRAPSSTDTTGCKTFIKAVNDVQFFERLSNLGDPNSGGKATCFHGLGEHYGMDIAFLRAIEWHRRGFVGDGPMKWVVDYLGNKGHKLGHLVWYFAQPLSARSDIVCHIVDDCRSHIGCQYCQRLKNSMLVP